MLGKEVPTKWVAVIFSVLGAIMVLGWWSLSTLSAVPVAQSRDPSLKVAATPRISIAEGAASPSVTCTRAEGREAMMRLQEKLIHCVREKDDHVYVRCSSDAHAEYQDRPCYSKRIVD
jgi:hypothetical protein